MIPYLPKQISIRAIIVYLIALATVSLLYFGYAMSLGYMFLGIVFVTGFFLSASYFSSIWLSIPSRRFVRSLFLLAVSLRLIWVVASYFFYKEATGIPFEFGAADSLSYHEGATILSQYDWGFIFQYYFGDLSRGVSDLGYYLCLTSFYKLFGNSIILPRLIKAFLSAFTCILIYRLSIRTFGEEIGRMAGIMASLMPNLIIYCGFHLKETEMIFITVAFLERVDYILRSKRINFWNILLPSLLALSLFFFRTVLGAAAVFSFVSAVLFSSTPMMKKGGRRIALIGWGVLGLLVASGGTIMTEVESFWEDRDDSVIRKRTEQTLRGNQWAKYATGTVMAPMVFVLPFATMVNVDQQYGQQEKHGGNYIRNFMGFFAILAVYEAFRRKKWRDFSLIGSFVIAYLGVVSLSGFSNSERFLLPGLPCLIMMWAYGVSNLRKQTYKLLLPWSVIVCAMEIAWAFFKLGSRGLF